MATATARFSSTTGDGAGGAGGVSRLRGGRARPPAEPLRSCQGGEATPDEQLIPPRAVLIQQQDGLARWADPRPRARRLDLHERHEAVDLRLARHKLGPDPPESKRFLAGCRPQPLVTGGRGVALVEDE